MNGKVTLEDVAQSVTDLALAVKKGFDGVDARFKKVDDRFNQMETGLKREIAESKTDLKDYIDRRIGRTDGKINALVNVLEAKKVITEDEKRLIHT